MPATKRRIAVLGGGISALTAVLELTSIPDWHEQIEDITVYQMGWRLGGKGASGRNAARRQRIEEHGLHLWFGFYENAFDVIRRAYDEQREKELWPSSPFQSWRDAFRPQQLTGMLEKTSGNWEPWIMSFPLNGLTPGDPELFQADHRPLSAWNMLVKLLGAMVQRLEEHCGDMSFAPPQVELSPTIRQVLEPARPFVSHFKGSTPLHLAEKFAASLKHDGSENFKIGEQTVLHLLEVFWKSFLKTLQPLASHNAVLRRVLIAMDVNAAMVRGMIVDGVIRNGYDSIDDFDFVQWLERNGSQYARDTVIPAYDACFAFEDGNPNKPNMAAGTSLRAFLRMVLTYKGAIVWRMNAGMGDTVFSPLYLVLKNRGVKFRFFHRVRHLELALDKTVSKIHVDVQARLARPESQYQPLVDVLGLPCWPSEPLYDQLANADELRGYDLESAWCTAPTQPAELVAGRDFDDIVLGISLAALPHVASELIAADSRWQDMIKYVKTVQTQGVQLWLNRTADEMGWKFPVANPNRDLVLLSGYIEPFDTYCDMSHLLPREAWACSEDVRSVAYLCNALQHTDIIPEPFKDPLYPASQTARVKEYARQFLNTSVRPFWPVAERDKTGFDWQLLHAENANGEDRLNQQFFRANVEPTERYVLSVAGSTKFRLLPGDSGFRNVVITGDWTYNYLNCGCVEAATISGKLAAQALCGRPKFIYGAFGARREITAENSR